MINSSPARFCVIVTFITMTSLNGINVLYHVYEDVAYVYLACMLPLVIRCISNSLIKSESQNEHKF